MSSARLGKLPANATGLTLAPVLVRIVVGVTFIWAGWGKLDGRAIVKGEEAAILANLGIIDAPPRPRAAPPDAPVAPLPSPGARAPSESGSPQLAALDTQLVALAVSPTLAQKSGQASAAVRTLTAEDFPQGASVRRVWLLALRIYKCAFPEVDKSGKAQPVSPPANVPGIWPRLLGDGPFPRFFALAVALSELIGGALVLIGLFTRWAGLVLAGVMAGAMWLDQIGPAWQTGSLVLGFLPGYDAYDPKAWAPLLWQWALCFMCLALALSGSGRLGVDWALGGWSQTPVRAPSNQPGPAAPSATIQKRSGGARG